jgi:hypothetical protein
VINSYYYGRVTVALGSQESLTSLEGWGPSESFSGASHPLWSFLPPQYIFLIQVLLKINANPLWSFLPSQYIFLIQFSFKIDEYPLWSFLPPQYIFLI